MTGWSEAEKALEARREIGILGVAREHLISEAVSDIGLRPTDEMVGHKVEGVSFNELLDSYSVEELEEWKRLKENEFGDLIEGVSIDSFQVDEDNKENLRIAREEYRESREIPDEVTEIVEGRNGLRQKWGKAESLSEVEEEFVEMVNAFREYSNGNYGEILSIWEPHIQEEKVEDVLEEIKTESIDILTGLDNEEIKTVWKNVQESIDTGKTLEDITDNPTGMHEFLANYVMGGNPVRMPVRIGGSGMEYGNSVMAPLQTVDDRFWAKCFDTTAHEFGHTYGRENLSSEHVFLPLGEPASEAIDEGTARFYQNQVFRSKEFLTEFLGPAAKEWFGSETGSNLKFENKELYRWFNAVNPYNTERISADPITYPLHIAIRYELEKELVESDEPVEEMVADLGARWQDKMQNYIGDPLGVEFNNMPDSETVLQDVHWGKGKFGYFPTYTLGDVMAAKWKEDMENDLERPFEQYLSNTDLEPVNQWIVENIWVHGKAVWSRSDYTELDTEPYKNQMRDIAKTYN